MLMSPLSLTPFYLWPYMRSLLESAMVQYVSGTQ